MTVGISGVVHGRNVPRRTTLSQSRFGIRELKNLSILMDYMRQKFLICTKIEKGFFKAQIKHCFIINGIVTGLNHRVFDSYSIIMRLMLRKLYWYTM